MTVFYVNMVLALILLLLGMNGIWRSKKPKYTFIILIVAGIIGELSNLVQLGLRR